MARVNSANTSPRLFIKVKNYQNLFALRLNKLKVSTAEISINGHKYYKPALIAIRTALIVPLSV
jgi:hypothetical protein